MHGTAQKNWDHFLLYQLLISIDRNAMLADLGCGEGHTLSLLHYLGFKNLQGVDYHLGWRVRARQLNMMQREKSLKPPFHLHSGDVTKTSFSAASCDVVISVSTLEHG